MDYRKLSKEIVDIISYNHLDEQCEIEKYYLYYWFNVINKSSFYCPFFVSFTDNNKDYIYPVIIR